MLQKLYNLRYWLSWIVLGAAAVAIVYWGFVYETDPRTIRVAVARDAAWHGEFAEALKRNVERQTDYRVQVLRTSHPDDSRSRILEEKADLAVLHPGSPAMRGLVGVAPLWDEYVQVLVRSGSGIDNIGDLAGRNVAIGREDSAERLNAQRLLGYYGVDPADLDRVDTPLSGITDDGDVEAAVVTRSPNDADMRSAMASGQFELLTLPAVAGFTFNHRHFRDAAIPAGVYPTPGLPLPVDTLAAPSIDTILAGRADLHPATVENLLPVIDSTDMRGDVPGLAIRNALEDRVWQMLPRHQQTERYFAEHERFGTPAGLLDRIADNAQWLILLLILAVIAGVQWRRQHQLSHESRTYGVKRELERLFQEVFRIEGAQREARDVRVMQEYLNEINQIKMKALKIALGTEVEESSLFLAFLQQARSVSQQIEWRLSMAASPASSTETARRGQ